jgi:hypothetical protein
LAPRGDGPKRAYSALIGRLILKRPVSEAEIDALPDPDVFRDALLLSQRGTFSPNELDDTDALLLALLRRFWNAKRG